MGQKKSRVLWVICLSFILVLLIPALAYAAVPNTDISKSPSRPDGYFGWYRSTPTITLTSDQPGTTYYQWDSTSGAWTTYTAPFQALIGSYGNDTSHVLYYYSTSGADTEGVKFDRIKVDPTLPVRIVGGSCEGCHGPGSYKDQLSFLVNTPHDLPTDPIQAPNRCQRCHKDKMEGVVPFLREDGIYDPAGGFHLITGNDNSLCFACHENGIANSAFPGKVVFSATKHANITSSGVALTRWVDKNFGSGMCGNCHDPHGIEGTTDYKNAAKNDLCFKCHDDPAAPDKPNGYAYRGKTAFNNTEHGNPANPNNVWPNSADTGATVGTGGATSGECTNCHNPHGKNIGGSMTDKLTMANEEGLCFSAGGGGCHSAVTGSVNGINILERLSYYPSAGSSLIPSPVYTGNYTGHHDVDDGDQAVSGGKNECKNCHNPHLDSRTNKKVNPDNTYASYADTTPDPFGYSSVVIKGTSNIQDTKIKSGSATPQETSPDDRLTVGKDPSAGIWRSLIKFDLSSVPANATITNAYLVLYEAAGGTYNLNVNIYPLTESWTEGAATWYKRDGLNNWSTAGGAYDSATVATKNVIGANNFYGSENFDVTNLVSGWYQGQYQNNGMILTSNASTNGYYRSFNSSEESLSTNHVPSLVVLYTNGSPVNNVSDEAGFCLKCHDGNTPATVTMPLGLKNINPTYGDRLDGEWHGAKASEGDGRGISSLRAPYYNGMPALPCTECHDPHGSKNVYHLKENMNGQAVTITTTGSNADGPAIQSFCKGCHNLQPGHHSYNADVAWGQCFRCHYHRGKLEVNLTTNRALF